MELGEIDFAMAKTWTVEDAKAHLSKIVRLAHDEGPQRIGKQRPVVVVSEAEWAARTGASSDFAAWLVDNVPRGEPFELPSRADRADRPAPFADMDDA